MTICIGLLASDGIVIAADAEEGDTYYKRSQQKILPFMQIQMGGNPTPPRFACAFTGAGDSGYIDAFFSYALRGIPTEANQNELEEYLAEKIRTFHEVHLFPLANSARPPEIDILIGSYCGFGTSLLVTHGSTMRRAFPHTAIGAGAHFAMSVIDGLFSTIYDVRRTEILAAYVIGITKDSIESCGKHTQIVSLHNAVHIEAHDNEPSRLVPPPHLLTRVSPRKIRQWEDSFGAKWSSRQDGLIAELLEEELAADTAATVPSDSRTLEGQQ